MVRLAKVIRLVFLRYESFGVGAWAMVIVATLFYLYLSKVVKSWSCDVRARAIVGRNLQLEGYAASLGTDCSGLISNV